MIMQYDFRCQRYIYYVSDPIFGDTSNSITEFPSHWSMIIFEYDTELFLFYINNATELYSVRLWIKLPDSIECHLT